MNLLVVNVADLLRLPAQRKKVSVAVPIGALQLTDSRLHGDDSVQVEMWLDSMTDGITVRGTVTTPWHSECRRCLAPVESDMTSEVAELFHQHPANEDIWPIRHDQADLEPLVIEAVMLELPLAPLCRADCAGLCPTCGADRNDVDCGHHEKPVDLRWGALEGLAGKLARTDEN